MQASRGIEREVMPWYNLASVSMPHEAGNLQGVVSGFLLALKETGFYLYVILQKPCIKAECCLKRHEVRLFVCLCVQAVHSQMTLFQCLPKCRTTSPLTS